MGKGDSVDSELEVRVGQYLREEKYREEFEFLRRALPQFSRLFGGCSDADIIYILSEICRENFQQVISPEEISQKIAVA